MNTRATIAFVVLLVALIIAAFAYYWVDSDEYQTTKDVYGWKSAPPPGFFNRPLQPIDDWWRVNSQSSDTAIDRLSHVQYVALSAREAAELTGRVEPAEKSLAGKNLFLVRALSPDPSSNSFSLRTDGTSVVVMYVHLGHSPSRLHRTPLVVALDGPPQAVYVLVSVMR